MSRELDGYLRRGSLPAGFEHFRVAARYGVSPYDVLHVWPAEMVEDALQIMAAEARNAD